MDFDTIITIILTLVFIFAGIFGGKKKPRQTVPLQSSDDEESGTEEKSGDPLGGIDSLLDKYLSSSDDEGSQDRIVYETAEEQEKEQDKDQILDSTVSEIDNTKDLLNKVEYSEIGKDTKYSDERHMQSIYGLKKKHRRSKKRQDVRKILNDFDGRKAVIYSEILNRKYF